jgi:hypothetical protein
LSIEKERDMNTTVAIIITIVVIAIIVILLVFQDEITNPLIDAISPLLIGCVVLVVMLPLVGGVVGGIIMMVLAVKANDVGLGVGGAFVTCVSIILIYIAGVFLFDWSIK